MKAPPVISCPDAVALLPRTGLFRSPRFLLAAALFTASGATALIYETVWIRTFSIAFGSTSQAMSTVLAVYLGGLAIGAFLSKRSLAWGSSHGLRWYGAAELFTGLWAALVPTLLLAIQPLLSGAYGNGRGAIMPLTILRAAIGALALLPATAAMGATFPLLAAAFTGEQNGGGPGVFYFCNLAGATGGALLTGFTLLPIFGFRSTSLLASAVNLAIGFTAMWLARSDTAVRDARETGQPPRPEALPFPITATCAFLSGFVCLFMEVIWGRVYSVLLGPTASTLTLILAVFLGGLAIGGAAATRVRRRNVEWLCVTLLISVLALAWSIGSAAAAPAWIAADVKALSSDPFHIEVMKLRLLVFALLPLTVCLGLVFPLTMRAAGGSRLGQLYSINTIGCIVGSLLAGWFLIPLIGTQTALLCGGSVLCGAACLLAFRLWPRRRWIVLTACAATLIAPLLVPHWDMGSMTAGAYKYAPYYATGIPGRTELVSMKEGVSSTVAVRRDGASLVLAIDGKVDASDAGGDLLTEKLLAHLPLLLAHQAKSVCIIGLASGVTAGAALTHPIDSLDVVELSPEVVEASHYFDHVNGHPLADPRTALIVNDGRNHLALTSRAYDVIISEPSNPWIAGMNSVFTRDFFRIARARLRPGGLLAQWFHIYNMPDSDLRSLLGAFSDVFPSAALWRLNDGDVLLTGLAPDGDSAGSSPLTLATLSDLLSVGLPSPVDLYDFYVVGGEGLARFAAGATRNTDDFPVLEFHGQRDLHAQTDAGNDSLLLAAATNSAVPEAVARAREAIGAPEHMALGAMFEKAESLRSAFRHYSKARELSPTSLDAIAGMDRSATSDPDRRAVTQALGLPQGLDTPALRTEQAQQMVASGDLPGAKRLLDELALASPTDPSAIFNTGVFSLEHRDYDAAIRAFQRAIAIDEHYVPAYEATAQAYAERHDYTQAAEWSRRILKIAPDNEAARRSLALLAQLQRSHP